MKNKEPKPPKHQKAQEQKTVQIIQEQFYLSPQGNGTCSLSTTAFFLPLFGGVLVPCVYSFSLTYPGGEPS